MKAELVPDNGDPPIRITRDLTVVGRRGFCDVVIDHPSLSKRHCVLVKTDGLLVVASSGSIWVPTTHLPRRSLRESPQPPPLRPRVLRTSTPTPTRRASRRR